jgi:Probable Zinc-ribbon domain
VPESLDAWWARRQFSKGNPVPYPIGSFRADWERYPALIRQYHPEFNSFVTLTQIPPAAEVYLVWECEVGHRFVATPAEQRSRPSGERRRSSWCPECHELAVKRPARRRAEPGNTPHNTARNVPESATTATRPQSVARIRRACGHGSYRPPTDSTGCRVCRHAAAGAASLPVGAAFVSTWAPKPASAVEADLKQRMSRRYEFDLSNTAIRVAQPFFTHLEVWPDILVPELAVAIELDTVGRHGLEHVGKREIADRRKDRLTRAAGWEVIRIRLGKLQPLGPYDLCATSITPTLLNRLDERLGEIRGELFVSAYRREPAAAVS